MFLETGLIMQTSPVTHVGREGHDLILETRNSRYRLELAS